MKRILAIIVLAAAVYFVGGAAMPQISLACQVSSDGGTCAPAKP